MKLRIEFLYYVSYFPLPVCELTKIWDVKSSIPVPYQFMENWLPSHSQ